MKRGDVSECRLKVLHSLSRLPQRMLEMHGRENIAELVLHELASHACLNFERAAYLVDNPDFDCLKGLAGFCCDESYASDAGDSWLDVDGFSQHVQSAPFNQRVRAYSRPSFRRRGASDKEAAGALASELGMQTHAFHVWSMKNDNYGLLVYEPGANDAQDNDYLVSAVSLLSFCPVV